MASAQSSVHNLSTAQAETYAMLLNMGFEGSNVVAAARIYGSNVSAAVNYLTSGPPPTSAFYHPQPTYSDTINNAQPQHQPQPQPPPSKTIAKKIRNNAERPSTFKSPDDIAISEFLDRIADTMQTLLEEDEIMESIRSAELVSAMNAKDAQIKRESEQKSDHNNNNNNTPYIAKTKQQLEYDEKTNQNIKKITKRLSLSKDQLQSQAMIGKATWFGDILSLREYPVSLMDELDSHGNTALSLACRLGHDSVSHSILEMGCDPMIELGSGWNVIQEAVLNKDSRLVRDCLIHQIQLRGNKYESRNKEIIAHLKTMPDFTLEIKWEITSVLAALNNLIAKFAKIDNFKIWKSGTSIRFDMFMKGFSAQGVEKGHVSFVFSENGIISIDHDRKTFTNAIRKYKNPDYDEMEREIRILMRTEQGRASLRTSNVLFERKKGWMGGNKEENIEGFQCQVMSTKGLSHSIIEDKRKNDSKYKWQHPSFEEYFEGTNINAFDDGYEHDNDNDNDGDDEDGCENKKHKKRFLRRKNKKKRKFDKKYFPNYIHRKDQPVDVTLWLCENYPLSDENISILLEAISIASEDMRKLADIFKLKFPGGFPVKLTMPIVVGISASATFCKFKRCVIPKNMFDVPGNYRLI